MLLKDKIVGLIADSMKQKTPTRTETLRLIKSELMKAEIADRSSYNEQKEIKTLMKMYNQRQESINEFIKYNRNDLAEKEQKELDIINEFLPKPINEDKLKEEIGKVINGLDHDFTMKDMKTVMSTIKDLFPSADGKLISQIAKTYIK